MLKKKVKTDYGADATVWKVTGFAFSVIEGVGFIELAGYATESAEKPVASIQVPMTEADMAQLYSLDKLPTILELTAKETHEWKNLK